MMANKKDCLVCLTLFFLHYNCRILYNLQNLASKCFSGEGLQHVWCGLDKGFFYVALPNSFDTILAIVCDQTLFYDIDHPLGRDRVFCLKLIPRTLNQFEHNGKWLHFFLMLINKEIAVLFFIFLWCSWSILTPVMKLVIMELCNQFLSCFRYLYVFFLASLGFWDSGIAHL